MCSYICIYIEIKTCSSSVVASAQGHLQVVFMCMSVCRYRSICMYLGMHSASRVCSLRGTWRMCIHVYVYVYLYVYLHTSRECHGLQ